ncbi:MAG: TonB-dependent receptor [Prevotella denticola]|uniref:SusC/RagA family TonB-linked outer membrane protein n=1 Tax=Prevotella denticola TaxID=28129 RepID=UPI001CABE4F4|nr:TonB-dependent receptor [Prevotella denticola]MBF1388899.1 TonB-dependent receptor [Prevotella denticola]
MKKSNFVLEGKHWLLGIAALSSLTLAVPMVAFGHGSVSTSVVQQNERTVKGVVKDSQGEPIIGATVTVVGKTGGTVTDIDGKFQLQAARNSELKISSIGFVSQTVKATSDNLNVILKDDNHSLNEIVVIGYGSQRKQDLSTAVSSVKLDQSMKSRPANIASMLQGQMPGVMVQNNGGDPLAESSLSIRGRGSRGTDDSYNSGDGVLYVVDGVPGAPYNVEDIESITVLKDAASAAIYGASVGSGGVVVITTKQAKAGKIRVNLNVSKGFKAAMNKPSTLTSEQYNQVWSDAVRLYGGSLPLTADATKYPYGAVTRTDWVDAIFRPGYLEHYALSLSGGSENLKAFTSFNFDRDKGILLNTFARKFGGKANVDFQISKAVKFSEQVTYQFSDGQGNVNTGHEGALANSIFFPRSATVYDYDKEGNVVLDSRGVPLYHGTLPRWAAAEGISGYGEFRNPVALLERLDQKRPSHKLYSTSTLEVKPMAALTLKSQFTAGIVSNEFDEFVHKVPEPGNPSNENRHNIEHSNQYNWLWETTATYAQVFGEHHISAMAGYTMKYDKYKMYGVYTSGYDLEDRHSSTLGQASDWSKYKPTEEIWEESLISMFGRVGYSWNDRYFATASLRRDASSKLYKDNNSGIFPAASASWKISSEPFFAPLKSTINMLKLRGSWGQVGNVALVPRYSWNVPMGNTDYPVIYGKMLAKEAYGTYAKSIGTKNLKWETTEQWGVGLDLGMFNNELTITVDYFNKRTKDLIERVPVASVSGIEIEPYGNIGDVVNRGWEFGASYNKKLGDFSFGLNANLSTVHNEVLSLGSRETLEHNVVVNSQRPLRSTVGHAWYSYYVLKTDGIFQSQEEINSYKWTDPKTGLTKLVQPNAKPGDLKYVDFNQDGQINSDDNQYMGSYMPKITFAFGGNMAYKGFDFSFQFQGVGKSTIYNAFKQMALTGRQQGGNMLSDILNAWDYDKNSGIPRLALVDDSNGNFTNPSDFYLENGSYLRLKNVTLGYTLPQAWLRSIGLGSSTLRLYMNAENLFTATDYTGIDPEVGNFGLDGGTYPIARTITVGLNFGF